MSQKLSDLAEAEERRQTVREAAAHFLRREWSLSSLRKAVEDDGIADSPTLWSRLRSLEWDRIDPKSREMGAAELCTIAEEIGHALAPTPLIPSVVGRALLRNAGAGDWDGFALPVLAHVEALRRSEPLATACSAQEIPSGHRLRGHKCFIPYGQQADLLIVSARLEDGQLGLFAVDPATAGLERESLGVLDATPCAGFRLSALEVPHAALIASGSAAERLLSGALALETLARCAELVGVAARALDMAVEYAKVREAFGRPIGSFQAVQHKLVNLRGTVEVARALYQGAAAQLAGGAGDPAPAVAMAAFAALDDLRKVPEGALQVFGGIGTTWEHDIHLLVRRAATLCALLGERSGFRATVAQHLTRRAGESPR
jgi:alkylation response protein AidB-like acyl-CoA dehydrogenase